MKSFHLKKYFPLFAIAAIVLAIPVTVLFSKQQTNTENNAASGSLSIYYGVDTGGSAQTLLQDLQVFETDAGKKVSIYQFFSPWERQNQLISFPTQDMNTIRQHGSIPMIVWQSRGDCANNCANQPRFSLSNIIQGNFDSYLIQWARSAAAWNNPFFIELDNQMNFSYFPYSEAVNGNHPRQFMQAWRHIHDIFVQNGATNVTWVWTPGRVEDGIIQISSLYPGDTYVDWVGTEVFAAEPASQGGYRSFAETVASSYAQLRNIAPSKPMMVADMGVTEFSPPHSKAQWLTNALSQAIPNRFTAIKAMIYDNINFGGLDSRIETSQNAQNAFATSIASFEYASNQYSCLSFSPIPPPDVVPRCSQPTGKISPTDTPNPVKSPTPTPNGGKGSICASQFQGTCMNESAYPYQCPSGYNNMGHIDCGSDICCSPKSAENNCSFWNGTCASANYCATYNNKGQLNCSPGQICCAGGATSDPNAQKCSTNYGYTCDASRSCPSGFYCSKNPAPWNFSEKLCIPNGC